MRNIFGETQEVPSHPHPQLPTFPRWKEDDVNTEHKEGRSTEYLWEQGEGCGKQDWQMATEAK